VTWRTPSSSRCCSTDFDRGDRGPAEGNSLGSAPSDPAARHPRSRNPPRGSRTFEAGARPVVLEGKTLLYFREPALGASPRSGPGTSVDASGSW